MSRYYIEEHILVKYVIEDAVYNNVYDYKLLKNYGCYPYYGCLITSQLFIYNDIISISNIWGDAIHSITQFGFDNFYKRLFKGYKTI